MNKKKSKKRYYKKELSIQSIIMFVLTTLTLVTVVIMGGLLYDRFKQSMEKSAVSDTKAAVESVVERVNSKFLDIRHIFNAASYNVIQEYDISSQEFDKQFSLIYEINSDKLQSIALYRDDGTLIASDPVAVEKENIDVKNQDWYIHAENDIENIHFSIPHTQNLFQDGKFRYYRVISVSCSVDINDGGKSESGVLLIDMKCSVIEDVLKQMNESADGIYYYICNRDGEIVYHPRKSEMSRGLFTENSSQAAGYEVGVYTIPSDSGQLQVVVGSIALPDGKL